MAKDKVPENVSHGPDREIIKPAEKCGIDGVECEPVDGLPGIAMETDRFLRLAVGIAAELAKVHGQNLIHGSLQPQAILANPGTGGITLAGLSSRAERDSSSAAGRQKIEVSPAYMSPEQTGRMNRPVDHRTDLYSLGVTFYEMLTGGLPCRAEDVLGWVHCHIAHSPRSPREVVPRIPAVLSNIVMKLLAKNAEERYQTASGLKLDLEKCLEQWEAGKQLEPFPLAEQDVSDRLLVPQKLYGRERDLDALMGAFEAVAGSGTSQLFLISGYSGIGKTTLVHELHKNSVRERGIIISGKFDQFKRDIPYSTIAEAFRELIQQILTESEERVADWTRQIQDALGMNGRLITDIIPQAELIIGPQPRVTELPPLEAQNRFNMVFRKFLGVFAKQKHPLVIFLDDLQWADSASLKLLEQIMTHPDTRYLLIIGAYRDNEVGPAHPLMSALDTIRTSGARVQVITLAPLQFDDLVRLTADTVRSDPGRVEPLARIVFEKTQGNPFFVLQFLDVLNQQGLLAFDAGRHAWTWDVNGIEAKGFTDNVVDLVTGKLKRLQVRTQRALKLAGAVGNTFDLQTLAMIDERPQEEMADDLEEAVREYLLLHRSDYVFLHDRVQEAAYSLVPETERAEMHLKIGRHLLSHATDEEIDDKVFDIVRQLNGGIALITEPAEKETLFRLNALAGRKAKASIAYASALNYLRRAAALLAPDAWHTRYTEAFALNLDLAECEYLTGNFASAEALINELLTKAGSDLDRARIYRLRLRLYQLSGRFHDAVAAMVEALRLFGINLPEADTDIATAVQAQRREIDAGLAGRPITGLFNAPAASDPTAICIVSLIAESVVPVYGARPHYFPLISALGVNLSLRHGNTPASISSYSCWAIVLMAEDNISDGYEFSELAVRLVDRFDAAREQANDLVRHGLFANHRRHHVAGNLVYLDRGFRAAVEAGDLVSAGLAALNRVSVGLETGISLNDALIESKKYADFALESHNTAAYQHIRVAQQFAACLMGKTRGPASLESDTFSEEDSLAQLTAAHWGHGIGEFHARKLAAAVFYGDYPAALQHAEHALPLLTGMLLEQVCLFHRALATTALYNDATPAERQGYRAILDSLLPRFELWVRYCPKNFGNWHALVSAEVARVENRELEAMSLYEQAIRSAKDNGFVQYEALANELCSRFHRTRGFDAIADTYLRQARGAYARWGADGKVGQLDRQYPYLQEEQRGIGALMSRVDAITVSRASQAISGEILLPRLLDTLMRIVLENSGAQKGSLLLMRDDELSEAARAGAEGEEIKMLPAASSRLSEVLPLSIVNYVRRTRESVILDNAADQTMFSPDEYILRNKPASVMCLPVMRQAKLIGLLYLENDLVRGAFTPDRTAVLEAIAAQAAISIENSTLYGALSESKGLLQAIIDNSTAVIYVKDLEGRYLLINRRYEELFHITKEAVVGKIDHDLFPRQQADAFRVFDQKVIAAQGALESEETVLLDDGAHTYISIKAPLFDASGQPYAVCGISADITERKRAEIALQAAHDELETRVKERTSELSAANEQLRQRHIEASVLYQVSSVISRSLHMDKLLTDVLNTISSLGVFNIDKGGIFVIEGDRMKMIASLGHSEAFLDLHKDMKVGDCLCGIAAKTGEILISPNSAQDSRHMIVEHHATPHGHLIVPLKTKERVEGVMDLYMPVGAEISEAKVNLLATIGNQMGIAIENARLYEETRSLSLHDSLTGLWNHEEILRILDRELARAEREGSCVGVILADLDHFKMINDTYGHVTGDTVLRLSAERMRSLFRPYDAVGRYGGEEFLVVLPACDETFVARAAERIRKSIGEEGMAAREGTISVTISLGVAISRRGGNEAAEALVRAADNALYRAKKNGRNRVEVAYDGAHDAP